MADIRTVNIDDIEEPTPSEQLHPETDEPDDNWEGFKQSIGDDPAELPSVIEDGDGYQLITGHRRLRALEQNGVEDIDVRVRDLLPERKYLERLIENYQRIPSDPDRRSWYTAQYVSPWLIPPDERWDEIETIWTNGSFADEVGLDGGGSSVSNWLPEIKEEYPLRTVLGDIGNSNVSGKIGWDKVDQIDRIMELLLSGGGEGGKVVLDGEKNWVSEEIDKQWDPVDGLLRDLSLGEIEDVTEMAVEEKLGSEGFVELLVEKCGVEPAEPTTMPEDIEHGPMSGDDPFEDTRTSTPKDADRRTGTGTEPELDEEDDESSIDFGFSKTRIEWDDLIDDDDLVHDEVETVGRLKRMKMEGGLPAIQDDAAVALNAIVGVTGMTKEEAWREFCQPAMVEQVVSYLNEHVADQ